MFRSSKYSARNGFATYIPISCLTSTGLPRSKPTSLSFNAEFQNLENSVLNCLVDFLSGAISGPDAISTLSTIEETLVQQCATIANTPGCC